MLKKPQGGWSTITIGDWSERCSWLDDVPFIMLGLFDAALMFPMIDVSALFDAEGYSYRVVIRSEYGQQDLLRDVVVVTEEEDDITCNSTNFDINLLESYQELVNDIRENIDDWSKWCDYGGMDKDEFEQRKSDLLYLCDTFFAER